jgi:tyrosine-protein phosphatase non-receptor type 4
VTHIGLVVCQNNIRINTFSWSKIMKISFKRKQFFIQLIREPSEDYDTLLGFNMESYRSSKLLWKSCVEHHTFFRLDSPKVKRKFPFSWGSKFTYSGRTEYQTVADVRRRGKLERKFVRSPSKQLVKQQAAPSVEDKGKVSLAPGRPPRPYDNKVTSLGAKEPRKAWADDSQMSDE